MNGFERMNRELVYKANVIDIYEDTIKCPDGKIVKYDYIDHIGAVAVVPVLDDGRILMEKQYRNALDRDTLEIPAGKLDSKEEKPIDAAMRELEEETGYKSTNLELLITLRTTVAFCNEKIEVYVAHDFVKTAQNLDDDEDIDVYAYTIEELCELIYESKIQDAKTIAAIMAYKDRYCCR